MLLFLSVVWTLVNQGSTQFTISGNNGNASGGDHCPTWFVPVTNENGTTCKCGDNYHRAVHCSQEPHEVGIMASLCMTYWSTVDMTVIGRCPYNRHIQNSDLVIYRMLSNNITKVNGSMCGSLNREGLLCGKCKSDYHPTVNSYNYSCINCTDGAKNWAIFLSVTFLPTTIFFLLVMIFRINANAPPLSAFVLFCQLTCSSDLTSTTVSVLKSLSVTEAFTIPMQILYTIYSVWSLDFLRTVIPPYCLPGVNSSMKALAMEYVVAFYPLVLVLLAYLSIRMHHYNIRPVVVMWRPFHRLFVRAKRSWDPNASVINTFATFLLLSYWKLTYVSFQFLASIELIDTYGTVFKTQHFYYDASQKLFHGDHLPFALLAITIIATFVVLPPIILCLYPTRLFRKFLWCIRIRGHGIVAFMDVFQGSYKNGTDGTRDWRCLSGGYYLLRILVLAVSSTNGTIVNLQSLYIVVVAFMGSSLAVLILKPYQLDVHTVTDSLILAAIALNSFMVYAGTAEVRLLYDLSPSIMVLYIASLLAPLLFIGIFVYFGVKRKYFTKKDGLLEDNQYV